MEALGQLFTRAVQGGRLQGFAMGKAPAILSVSHLFYVDDALIFCDADVDQIGYLRCVLLCFEAVSGLRVNLAKSELIPVGEMATISVLVAIMGCKVVTLPVTYLGLPLGPSFKSKGTVWTAIAHVITGVIGAGVLSLAWCTAQLGWVGGPVTMLVFVAITIVSADLLCDCYRSPDPEYGPTKSKSCVEAGKLYLGENSKRISGLFLQESMYGCGVAFVITSAASVRTIQKSNCHHKEGHKASCEYGDTVYMVLFGVVQIVASQIPDFHNMASLSFVAAIMSFFYSSIGFVLGFATVIENKKIMGRIGGVPAGTTTEKLWLVFQALGDVAFAYPYTIILLEIQKEKYLKLNAMKRILRIGTSQLDLVGGYQVYSQPVFAIAERWFGKKYPNSRFVNNFYNFKLPLLSGFQLNPLRLCFRTFYVISTTVIAVIFPYFNQVLGVLGALNFWPLAIYFLMEMYFVQKKIRAWTTKWIVLQTFSIVCLIVSILALIGSVEGLIRAKLS
ncbi:probable amino acid permease 7 [Camellia sinensis]|uniref:probable amino acid permease 7 n=1 Tax=Camellia sinensis TaxID=4442 RepID=UPI00103695B8|nr:probable amino acid permease 7 [Camellia sinensis]